MAAHHLTIAKASFTASLLRPESVPLTRDSISEFHTLLDAAVSKCTSSNVQKCKAWVLTTIAPFPARSTAFGKYLASLARHLPIDDPTTKGAQPTGLTRATAISRRRLHILYILNDLFHHAKHHHQGNKEYSILTSSLQPFLAEITSSIVSGAKPKVQRRLGELIEIWRSEHYFAGEYIAKLRSIVEDGPQSVSGGANGAATTDAQSRVAEKEPPYIMPSTHGDPSTPYYDLPAGNLLPHIIPNSTVPIRPDNIKPLQFVAGPADESLVHALRDFMHDVDQIDNEMSYASKGVDEEGLVGDINELGQVLWKDPNTGEVVKGDSYYGWSREFCEKMKRRRKGQRGGSQSSRSRSRSYTPSMSRSRSRSPNRRRDRSRYSSSRSRSRSRTPGQRQSYSPPEPENNRPSFGRSMPQPSFVPASSGPPQPQQRQTSIPPPPPPPLLPFNMSYPPALSGSPPIPSNLPFPPPPHLGLGPNGLPIPPPRPAGYMGPWPPPPPPPQMGYGPGGAGSPPPPPMGMGGYGQGNLPPPPPPHAGGRGGHSGGRGGWAGR